MKKIMLVVTVCLICVFLVACSCEHIYDAGAITAEATCTETGTLTYTCTKCGETQAEIIPTIEHVYSVETLKEANYAEEGILKYTCANCGDNYTEKIPIKEAEVIVTVTEKESLPKDRNAWRFSDYVRLSLNIENTSNRSIKGIQGTLVVEDMFGEEFLRSSCDLTDDTIPANSSITVTELYLDINQFFESHLKLFNTEYENLIFEYIVTNVMFTS